MVDKGSTYTTVLDAVRAARIIQEREDDGYGVGVSFDLNERQWAWIQWCHTREGATDWNVDVVEICFPKTREDSAATLRSRGYSPHETASDEYDANIWHLSDDQKSWGTEEELVAYMAEQIHVIGGVDGMTFTAYP